MHNPIKHKNKTPLFSPAKDQQRVAKLQEYLQEDDYVVSGSFQHIASMAARIFDTPVAFVNFVDEKNIIIKASVGVTTQSSISRELGLCSLAVLHEEVVVFEDAKQEASLVNNPIVHGEFGLQFYAGAPVKTPDGYSIGVVAIADVKPRSFSLEDREMLESLAAMVMEELEDRQSIKDNQPPK